MKRSSKARELYEILILQAPTEVVVTCVMWSPSAIQKQKNEFLVKTKKSKYCVDSADNNTPELVYC